MNKAATIATIIIVLLLGAGVFYYANRSADSATDGNAQSNLRQGTPGQSPKDIREAVWEQLPAMKRDQIGGTWKDAKVSKITLTKEMMGHVRDTSYEGKEVYIIDFPVKREGAANNIIVYADTETFTYIGDGLVD